MLRPRSPPAATAACAISKKFHAKNVLFFWDVLEVRKKKGQSDRAQHRRSGETFQINQILYQK